MKAGVNCGSRVWGEARMMNAKGVLGMIKYAAAKSGSK